MRDPADLSEKVAIVTGAGGGMGRAIALRLASGGARIFANDLSLDAARRTASEVAEQGGKHMRPREMSAIPATWGAWWRRRSSASGRFTCW